MSLIQNIKPHVKGFVLHWTAGTWSQTFDDYHFCITYDGKLAHVKQTRSLAVAGEHVWHRNTGLIGISLCGMYDNPKTKGLDYPIEQHQIEVCAKLVAELCYLLDLDPDGTYVAQDLNVAGKTHNVKIVGDHKTYAIIDGYEDQRWDIGHQGDKQVLYPVVYNKVQWYYSKLKNGTAKAEFTLNLK